MSDELFNPKDVAVESPRLLWMKENKVKTLRENALEWEWMAWCSDESKPMHTAFGGTEVDAITSHAIKRGIPLWNETGIKSPANTQPH